MKKALLPLVLVLIVLISSCTQSMTSEQKDKMILSIYSKDGIEAAKAKVVELYKDNNDKATAWFIVFNEKEDKQYIDKLIILNNWTWEVDGNYSYVRGRVKNTSDKNIRYFEVTAEYLDSAGNVLDTDYTNSGETLKVGNMKEFEIMHKDSEDYKEVRIFVNEVSVE